MEGESWEHSAAARATRVPERTTDTSHRFAIRSFPRRHAPHHHAGRGPRSPHPHLDPHRRRPSDPAVIPGSSSCWRPPARRPTGESTCTAGAAAAPFLLGHGELSCLLHFRLVRPQPLASRLGSLRFAAHSSFPSVPCAAVLLLSVSMVTHLSLHGPGAFRLPCF